MEDESRLLGFLLLVFFSFKKKLVFLLGISICSFLSNTEETYFFLFPLFVPPKMFFALLKEKH